MTASNSTKVQQKVRPDPGVLFVFKTMNKWRE